LVSLGSIRDITDLAKPYMDHLPKIAWDMVTYEGKIWALPANSPAAGMFYRSDVLEKYGINPDDLTTWDAWIEAGKKVVRESNGKVMWFNAPKDQVGYYIDNTIFQQYRAEILSSDGKVTVNSQEYRNALSLIERIRNEKLSAPIEDWTAPWYQTMKDGTLACYGSGTWFVQTIIQQAPDTKGKWYFTPFPAVKAGGDRYPNYGSASCFISSQTKNVDAAFEWCKAWSIDPRGSLDIGLKELGISVVSTAALDNNFVNQPHEYFAKNQAYWLDATKAFSNGIYVPPVLIQSGEASGIWNRYYEEWQLGKIGTNDALSQAETELKTKLRL
jgi:lactose/L-arabinose transport system substrate-binding protein